MSDAAGSGWAALACLVGSLLLMVRWPPLARPFGGLDHQYAWHHGLGLAAYLLMLLHPLAVAWPLANFGSIALLPAVWFGGWPVLAGWLALVLVMTPLGLTFLAPMAFRPWLNWHRVTLLGALAAFAHAGAFVRPPAPAWAVLTVLAGLTVLAVLMRVWLQRGGGSRPYTVTVVGHPAPHTVEVELRPLRAPLPLAPGQYVFAGFAGGPDYRGCDDLHPFTASAVAPGRVRLTIKALGDCTQHMLQLAPGAGARLQGPYGAFFTHAGSGPQVWIAGGIGITPFLARLPQLSGAAEVAFAVVVRDPHECIHGDEIDAAAARLPGLRATTVVATTSLDPLLRWLDAVAGLARRQAFLCGPPGLIDACVAALRARGVPRRQIHFERFDFR